MSGVGAAQVLAFRIAGAGRLAQTKTAVIALIRVKQVSGKLGRLTKAERQDAGRQRVQATRVAGLGRIEQTPGALQCAV